MNKLLIIVVICLSLSGCTITNKLPQFYPDLSKKDYTNWYRMTGKWYGNMESEDKGKNEWLVERNLDGTYIIQFKNTDKMGNVEKSTEIGEWGISGNIYFTIY